MKSSSLRVILCSLFVSHSKAVLSIWWLPLSSGLLGVIKICTKRQSLPEGLSSLESLRSCGEKPEATLLWAWRAQQEMSVFENLGVHGHLEMCLPRPPPQSSAEDAHNPVIPIGFCVMKSGKAGRRFNLGEAGGIWLCRYNGCVLLLCRMGFTGLNVTQRGVLGSLLTRLARCHCQVGGLPRCFLLCMPLPQELCLLLCSRLPHYVIPHTEVSGVFGTAPCSKEVHLGP